MIIAHPALLALPVLLPPAGVAAPSGGLPDLVVRALVSEESQVEPGDRVSLEFNIANIGIDEADEFLTGYFLSTDTEYSEDDRFLEDEELGDLDVGDSEDESEQVSIPSAVVDGEYYILVVLDYPDFIAEQDETNNTDATPITIGTPSGVCTSSPCPMIDLAEPCSTLDVFDILAFLDRFTENDPDADFNNDAVIDVFDVLAYLDAYTSGCP